MIDIKQIIKDIKKIDRIKVFTNEPLARHTSFRIGGPARILVIPSDVSALQKIMEMTQGYKKYVIGNGSDLLLPDGGLNGIVIKMCGGIKDVEVDGRMVTVSAAQLLQPLLKILLKAGLSGLEFGAWVPASLGGSVFMNMGAFDQEIGDLVEYLDVMGPSGKIERLGKKDIAFSYRKSGIKNRIIINVRIKLKHGKPASIEKRVGEYIARRKLTQPIAVPCAGSVFRNPKDVPAGKLIDMAGCKGMRVGGAEISRKHANFIINLGDATASDVRSLIKKTKRIVKDKFRVSLELELVDSKRLSVIS